MRRREVLRLLGGLGLMAAAPVGWAADGKGKTMRLEKLGMPVFDTTMMGVVKGALDYYGLKVSAATAFGASGHAFMINIHETMCPSGPYCWRRDLADPLLRNMGLEMRDLGFFSAKNTPEERATVERELRAALDRGTPCSLCNLEHQLIAGYDEEGFVTLQPWAPKKTDYPPARLAFGSWREFGDDIHVNFFVLGRREPAAHRRMVLDSLDYAVDLYAHPGNHSLPGYGVGPEAYAKWVAAVGKHGGSHGNWWNATVWGECRTMASLYFGEIGERYQEVSTEATQLAGVYGEIGKTLKRASDKGMDAAEKAKLLEETKGKEAKAVEQVAALAARLRSGGEA